MKQPKILSNGTMYGVLALLGALVLAVPLAHNATAQQNPPLGGARLTEAAQLADERQANAQATAQAVQTNAAATVQGGRANVEGTAQAVQTNAFATAQGAQTRVVSTVEMRATEIAVTVDAVRTEVVATAQAGLAELTDQLTTLDVQVDPEAGTVRLTMIIDEVQINTAINAALEAAGYGDVRSTVDLVPGGMVITLDGVTLENGQTVSVVLEFALTETDDTYELLLVSATANGLPVPTGSVNEVLYGYIEGYVEDIITGTTTDMNATLPEGVESIGYEVESIVITDDTIAVFIVVMAS